jgi:hypothetical protein
MALGDRAGHPLDTKYTAPIAEASLEEARSMLGDGFEVELTKGATMSLEAAIELARSSV